MCHCQLKNQKKSPWKISFEREEPLTFDVEIRSPSQPVAKGVILQSHQASPLGNELNMVEYTTGNDLEKTSNNSSGSFVTPTLRRQLFRGEKDDASASSHDVNKRTNRKKSTSLGCSASSSGKNETSVVKLGTENFSVKPLTAADHMTLLTLQIEMRQKMESIERLLSSILRAMKPSQKVIVPKDLPNIPLKTLQDFKNNEEYLDDKSNRADTTEYLSKLINTSMAIKEQVYSSMRKMMFDVLASQFNWKGHGEKLAVSDSILCNVIIGALMDASGKSKQFNISDVEDSMKEWLKHAPKRAASAKPTLKHYGPVEGEEDDDNADEKENSSPAV